MTEYPASRGIAVNQSGSKPRAYEATFW